jgi:flagellar hook-basal body complex protein FliE
MIDPVVSSLAKIGGTESVRAGTETKASAQAMAPGTDFSSMLSQMAVDAADSVKSAEAVSIAGIKGNASVQQVVESVMAAEQSLQTAVAVRDKVVAAYLEISRMTI